MKRKNYSNPLLQDREKLVKKNWGLGVSEVGDAESEEREKVGRIKIFNYKELIIKLKTIKKDGICMQMDRRREELDGVLHQEIRREAKVCGDCGESG